MARNTLVRAAMRCSSPSSLCGYLLYLLVALAIGAPARAQELTSLPRTGWTVSADSENTATSNFARNAIDGVAGTHWHTAWMPSVVPFPHTFVIDTMRTQSIAGLRYLPRQDGGVNGNIGTYGIDVSVDGANWANVAAGAFTDNRTEKTIPFAPISARYVRLRALGEAGNRGGWASASEINLLTTSTTPPVNPAVVGRWSTTIGFPLVPAAAAILPTNKLLTWSSYTTHAFGGSGKTVTATLDLATGVVSQRTVTETGHDMFCPGSSLLADGTVFVTGGDDSKKTSAYNPFTNTWTAKGDLNVGRGYQSTTTMGDGSVFLLGGSWSGGHGGKLGELWTSSTQWLTLPGASVDAMVTDDPQGVYRADNHGWFFGVGNDLVFHAGPSSQMNWYDTTGSGATIPAGERGGDHAMNGNAIMYDVNKILVVGGASAYQNATATTDAYVIEIDPAARTAASRAVSPMALPRAYHNSVVLPNGEVVVIGGQRTPVPFTDTDSAMEAELWDPVTESFTMLARMSVPRNYHAVALLLPDGRVFAGGGGLCGSCATNHADGEIFTPPYLFAANGSLASRPAIQSAPSTATHGQTLTVTTATPVVSFALVRLSSVTHSVNTDQRRIPLAPTSSNGLTHEIVVPTDPGVALPGVYFLFALDANGVPSVAKYLTIAAASSSPRPANLARGKSATQSSTFESGAAARAVDGNVTGNYGGGSVTHTTATHQAWWQVDLGASAAIEKIRLWNRMDCCADRLAGAIVWVSNTPFQFADVARTRTQPGVREITLPAVPRPSIDLAVGQAGRYVRVQLAGTNFLSLAEVEVLGQPLAAATNVARQGQASQSSTAYSGSASRAIDGRTDGVYNNGSVTHTNATSQPWWQVDLGTSRTIDLVRLWNRSDCCGERLRDVSVFVSDTPFRFNTVSQTRAQSGVREFRLTGILPRESSLTAGVRGRYVRVQIAGTNFLSLAEVEVMGR